MKRTKRSSLVAIVGAVALMMAACGGGDGPDSGGQENANGSESSDDDGSGDGSSDGEETEVEVFTWWATGFEELGLNALVEVFNEQHPNVEFINGAVAGGAGSQAKDLLQTRLQTNDPPDTFQAHAGKELQDYIDAGQVEDISDLYDELGLNDAFPETLMDQLLSDGAVYSIPANVHRANVIWANTDVLAEAGLSDDIYFETFEDFIDALEAVEATGKIGLSIATTWTQVHLLETVLLGVLGPDTYSGLWDGTGDWESADVTEALQMFERLLEYTNTDRDGIDNSESSNRVVDGEAGFTVMGDWDNGVWEERDKSSPEDFVYAPTPQTKGVFDYLADSFTWPVGAPHPDGTKAWLATVASPEGQIAFNTHKGSIPARSDIDASEFPSYQQSAMEDFANDTIVSSVAHGAATTIAQLTAISDATSKYTAGGSDIDTFQKELAAAMS